MKNHLATAHHCWRQWLRPDDVAVDATCGNGRDTEILTQLAGTVWGFDVQMQAIEKTRQRCGDRVRLLQECHTKLELVTDRPIRLVVYNLGYLPGGDKSLTTRAETTVESLKLALKLAGAVSLTCYPGHPEGQRELEALAPYLGPLPAFDTAPIFFWLENARNC